MELSPRRAASDFGAAGGTLSPRGSTSTNRSRRKHRELVLFDDLLLCLVPIGGDRYSLDWHTALANECTLQLAERSSKKHRVRVCINEVSHKSWFCKSLFFVPLSFWSVFNRLHGFLNLRFKVQFNVKLSTTKATLIGWR